MTQAAPIRIQLSRKRGFRLQEHSIAQNGLPAIVVARPSRHGNPFKVVCLYNYAPDRQGWGVAEPFQFGCTGVVGLGFRRTFNNGADARGHAANLFREAVASGRWEVDLAALRGKNLACWCPLDHPCHADVLLELANRPVCEEVRP